MKKSILLLTVILIFAGVQSFPQGLKFGAGGGLSLVQSPEYYTKDVADGGFGFGTEYHIGLKVKLGLPLVPVIPVGFVNYHMFSGSGESSAGPKDITQNLLTIGVGIEYVFIPGPLSPYAALDLQFNSFGDIEGLPNPLPGESRTGLGIGAGAEFSLIPVITLDVSAKYNMLNLMGQTEGEENIDIITLNVTVLFGGI